MVPLMDREVTVPFSIGMWLYPTVIDANMRTLYNNYTSTKGKFALTQSGQITAYILSSGTQGLAIRTGNVLVSGLWTHFVFTYDGTGVIGGLKIYINGVENVTSTILNNIAGPVISGNAFQLGAQGSSRYHTGNLDEVSIWDKKLSASEVEQVYNAGIVKALDSLSFSGNLAHWWRMGDEDIYPTIVDHKGGVNLVCANMIATCISPIKP
jgi:hypothetical protein